MRDNEDMVYIKIPKESRALLKEYCKYHGYKMYAVVEKLIAQNCTLNKVTKPTESIKLPTNNN